MLPALSSLPLLPGPFELLELQDGQSATFRVLSFTLGRTTINPRDGRAAKEVAVLRVVIDPAGKPDGPPYWDIAGQLAAVSLLAHLQAPDGLKAQYTLTKHGTGARGRQQLTAAPL